MFIRQFGTCRLSPPPPTPQYFICHIQYYYYWGFVYVIFITITITWIRYFANFWAFREKKLFFRESLSTRKLKILKNTEVQLVDLIWPWKWMNHFLRDGKTIKVGCCHNSWCSVDGVGKPKESFMYAVPDRSAATLLPIIQTSIRPGTTITSDLWRAYGGIAAMQGMGYITTWRLTTAFSLLILKQGHTLRM